MPAAESFFSTLKAELVHRNDYVSRSEPSTAFSTELGKPANGCRFPTSVNRPAALRRGAFARSLPFPTDKTYNRQKSDAGNTSNPVDRIGAGSAARREP